jgi:hypothetical protein
MGFLVIWLIAAIGAFVAIPDNGETHLQRVFKAAIYAFIFVIIAVIVGNAIGILGGEDVDLDYRR